MDTAGGTVDTAGGTVDTAGGTVDTAGGTVDTAGGTVDAAGGSSQEAVATVTETVGHVKAAMDAAEHLYSNYLLAGDGSVITVGETSYQDVAAGYARLDGVKKLCVSPSEFHTFALTESGDLYAGTEKMASGVSDMVFCTTNTNEEGYILTGSSIQRIGGDKLYDTDCSAEFVRLNGDNNESVSSPVYIGVDKHCFFVLDTSGHIFMDKSSSYYDACGKLGIYEWDNLALAGIAIYNSEPETLTAAGIRKDGTVVAAGDYADDILGWGPLSYISMGGGTIVGLTSDGSLKVTGQAAELISGTVEGWSNIAAVKVGRHARLGDLVTAMDANGDFYYVSTERDAIQDTGKISQESGSTTDMSCYKYAQDGTVYRSRDNGGWVTVD